MSKPASPDRAARSAPARGTSISRTSPPPVFPLAPFHKQIGVGGLAISDHEKELVNQVLESNQLTYGPMTMRFEREFAASHDSTHALFLNSGTCALHVALQAMKNRYGWADGDEVIVPSVTFVATANIVLQTDMIPVFVDVEPDTYNIDPSKIEEKITSRTRAIIPVHLLGLPAAMKPILEIAKTYRLRVIEDSCESMFARYGGKRVGSMGDIGCFSTYVAHMLVTGVGGLAITSNEELATDMRSLMNHGRDPIYSYSTADHDVDEDTRKRIVDRRFSFIHVGFSYRCTELEAAIGVGQLARAKDMCERRIAIGNHLLRELAPFSDRIQLPVTPPDRTHAFMLFGIVVRNEPKYKLVHHLERLRIETRDMLPLINQPIYKRLFGDLEQRFPVAKHLNNSAFYIGCHSYMTDDEVCYVADAFKDFFRRN